MINTSLPEAVRMVRRLPDKRFVWKKQSWCGGWAGVGVEITEAHLVRERGPPRQDG